VLDNTLLVQRGAKGTEVKSHEAGKVVTHVKGDRDDREVESNQDEFERLRKLAVTADFTVRSFEMHILFCFDSHFYFFSTQPK
jgi:hypothetical protein